MITKKTIIPFGYEIDQEKSSFEEIVFKKIITNKHLPKTWEEYYKSNSRHNTGYCLSSRYAMNNICFNTEEDIDAYIALMKLQKLRDVYRDGWTPDWKSDSQEKFCILFMNDKPEIFRHGRVQAFLSFPREDIAEDFITNFSDLLEIAKKLL
jgi:hypothetical protein